MSRKDHGSLLDASHVFLRLGLIHGFLQIQSTLTCMHISYVYTMLYIPHALVSFPFNKKQRQLQIN